MTARAKKRLLIVVAVLFVLFGTYQATKRLMPLELADLSSRWDLWRGGVTTTHSGELEGYARNLGCSDKPPTPGTPVESECHCVALIHGAADSAMTWKRVLLSSRADWKSPTRLYAWDLPGFGRSAAPPNAQDYRVRALAGKVRDALAAIPQCQRWMVVGNSFGGWVSAWLAIEWGRKVNKLVLVGSAGLKRKEEEGRSLLNETTVETLKEFQRRAYHKPRELPDYVWEAAARRAKEGHTKDLFTAQTPDDYLDTYLSQLHTPTMVIWGDSDHVVPLEAGRQMAALIPGAILRELRECGHLPQKECAKPFLDAMNDMAGMGAM